MVVHTYHAATPTKLPPTLFNDKNLVMRIVEQTARSLALVDKCVNTSRPCHQLKDSEVY